MKKIVCLLFFLLFNQVKSDEKVLIITHSFSRPEFIEIQYRCFKAFLKDEYEFVVFNDAPNESMAKKIEDTCNKLDLQCYRVPQALHDTCQAPSARHGHGIKYSFEQIGFKHEGILFLVDSDIFLIKPFSVNQYMADYDFVALKQTRGDYSTPVVYVSPLLVLLNMKTLPNKKTLCFDRGWINGHECDTGAQIYYYFKNNPCVKVRFYPELYIDDLSRDITARKSFDKVTCKFFDALIAEFDSNEPHNLQLHADHFIHYRAGSNYDNKSEEYHIKKTRIINDYINDMIITHNKC